MRDDEREVQLFFAGSSQDFRRVGYGGPNISAVYGPPLGTPPTHPHPAQISPPDSPPGSLLGGQQGGCNPITTRREIDTKG